MFHGRQKIREYMMLTVHHGTILGIDRWFLLTRIPWLSLKRLSYNRLLCPNRLTAQNGASAHEPVCHLGQKALFPSGEGREGPLGRRLAVRAPVPILPPEMSSTLRKLRAQITSENSKQQGEKKLPLILTSQGLGMKSRQLLWDRGSAIP